ncbi:DnaJ-domain-containing protein [Martensiomyces pterosporus]|nr:DnaJ-domain-containing protein [Martensiomyces pterosporus]
MEREWAATSEGGVDYYSVLNVSREATSDDVREAYKRLSRLFHPDRHHSAEKREWAQRQFHSIQRAYEVLTDPARRAAFDQFGEQGLRSGMAVGYKMHSAQELRESFEREARKRRLEEVEQWVQSKSDITAELDSAKLVSPMIRQLLAKAGVHSVPASDLVNVKQLFMRHSFTAGLTDNLSGTLTGHMVSRNNRGAGNIIGTLKRTFGPQSWVSLSVPALPPYVVTMKSTYQPMAEAFCTGQVSMHSLDLSSPPSATVTLGRLMTNTTTAFMTMRTGNQYALGPFWRNSPTRIPPPAPSGVSVGLSGKHGEKGEFVLDVSAGLQQSHISANYTRKIDSHFSVSGGVVVGIGEVSANIAVEGEVDDWTKVGWKVDFGLTSGVKVTVHLQRLGHRIQLPVLLTPLLEADLLLYAAGIPFALAFGLHYTVLKPRRRRRIQQRMEELKEEQRYQLFQQKRHAEEAVRLMAASVERSRSTARSTGGLVIEAAYYGDLPFGIASQNTNSLSATLDTIEASRKALSTTDEPRACDVTLALHALISNSQLVIAGGGSKRFLPGFYDPAFGAKKSLFVRYSFKGVLHEVIARDDQPLAIPMKAHSIE